DGQRQDDRRTAHRRLPKARRPRSCRPRHGDGRARPHRPTGGRPQTRIGPLSSATHEASTEPTPADPQVTDRGARIGRFVVTAAVRIAKHTMVLQARDPDGSFVAVKLANTMIGGELVDREIDLLRVLGTRPCPGARSVADGTQAGRRYVATRRIPRTDARVAAAELRQGGRPVRALELGARIARAYADLHAAGVLHGQVHPRHVLVDRDGAVGLLDLSVAATASDVPAPARLAARF